MPIVLESKRANSVLRFGRRLGGGGLSTDHQSFREKMLITHRGLSGPAILQISSYWNPGKPIRIESHLAVT